MLRSNNTLGAFTLTPVTSTDGQFSVHWNGYIEDVTTASNLFESSQEMGFSTPQGMSLWVQSGKLIVTRWAAPILGTNGRWDCDISIGAHSIQVILKCDGDEAQNPTVYVDGVAQTLTEVVTPVTQYDNSNVPMYFSFVGNARLMLNPPMAVAEVAIWTRALTAWECAYLGKSMRLGLCTNIPNCVGAWRFDFEKTHSTDTPVLAGGMMTAVADGNITWAWTGAGTGYADIDADDGTYIQASKDDDGLENIFTCTSFTLQENHFAFLLEVAMKLRQYASGVYPSAAPGYWYGLYSSMNYGYKDFNAGGTTQTTVKQRWVQKLDQNALDYMTLYIKAPASIGQDEEVNVYYTPINVYGGHLVKPYVGTAEMGCIGGYSASNKYFNG